MSNLFKKVTSSVAALTVVFSVVSPIAGANAAYTSSIEAANKLAASGVITDKSANPADYRLGDNITRREIVKVAIQLASCQDVTLNTEYKGKFSDVPSTDWAWKYAETAVDNGFIAANAKFDPSRNVSKAEALKMVMNATQVAKADGEANFWDAYVKGAVAAGVTDTFSDYDAAAQRGWIFKAAANALDAGTCGASSGSILDDLLNNIDNTDGTSTGTTTNVSTGTTTTSTGGTFTVALSPDTPAAASVPAGVNGLPVAAYDFTAGDSDVTITSITLKRKGLSDKSTLTGLAAFTSDGRASKAKNDSENNDTEATLTLTNGFVVKAGETRTLTIVADVADAATAGSDEFAIELVEVVASATAQSDGSLVANTLRVGSVNAAKLTVAANGTTSNPKLGDQGVEIFKFKVTGDANEDTLLKGITFKADNSNASDDLANFKLYQGSTQIASTKAMEGKYVTFTLGTGINIAQNKTEKFTVKADVVAGAGDVVKFFVDKNLDVSAAGSRYGYGASVDITGADAAGELGTITLQAGELTLAKVDAPSDKIREDKKDTVLGSIKVTNVAGKNLELQQFGVKLDATYNSSATYAAPTTVNGVSYGAGSAVVTSLDDIFENFELYNQDTGASYELTRANSGSPVYSDADLNVALPQGASTFLIRADVKKNVNTTFDKYKFTLSLTSGTVGLNGGFYAVETADDKQITDISPSSLSWKTINGTESAATVSVTPLSNVTKVQGSSDIVALQFEVQADQSSALVLDEVRSLLLANGVAADNQTISQASLYQGTVSDANLLDRVSGSNLASGTATFNGFNVNIPASGKQTFVVTVSLVDADFTGKTPVTSKLTLLSVQDDENNDVATPDAASVSTPNGTVYATPYNSARAIAVSGVGTLTVTADANNTDNKDDKTVLAGTSKTIYSADIQATNESVDVEQVTFTLAGTYAGGKTLKDVVTSASLYLGDTLIATNTNSDINAVGADTIRFKDLSNLIIPQETKELRLAINTATIGFERVGATTTGLTVTNVAIPKADGVDSGKSITVAPLASTASKATSIAPAVLTASVNKQLSNGTAEVKFTLDSGDNKVAGSNNKPSAIITAAAITNLANGSAYKVYNIDNVGGQQADFATLNDADTTVTDTETFVLVPQTTAQGTTYTSKIAKNAITYTVDGGPTLNVNLSADLDLGTKTY